MYLFFSFELDLNRKKFVVWPQIIFEKAIVFALAFFLSFFLSFLLDTFFCPTTKKSASGQTIAGREFQRQKLKTDFFVRII
jgi:hypothetical protein